MGHITEKQLRERFDFSLGEVKNYWCSGKLYEDRFEIAYFITCPCGKSRLYSENIYLGERKEINNNDIKRACQNASYRLMLHIEHQIRMNADKYHIYLLIEVIGKEEAIKLLDKWAKKNMVVAMALAKYIKELKSQEVEA